MPQYLLSYEVTPLAIKDVFEDLAPKHGWSLRVESSKKVKYRLPPGAMVGAFATIGDAEKALKTLSLAAGAKAGAKAELKKYILVEYAQSKFDSDERRQPAPQGAAAKKTAPAKAPPAKAGAGK